ncbi:uncharacterized protein BJ171DRAFT_625291 [Polychytrium aggregatum]|uniref:uncharacterized protein n=1 Tax=Polychytrium aggregatum TaxID=110093 RepID=UPI0022FEE6CA|nr:uncharacterized protein BJ171DRAFT_625291 [Polychytrium aggregatum]KAI9202956.1 hypothetical protein BJ171DRAFT_625291 [Polychytrium aggregatum]
MTPQIYPVAVEYGLTPPGGSSHIVDALNRDIKSFVSGTLDQKLKACIEFSYLFYTSNGAQLEEVLSKDPLLIKVLVGVLENPSQPTVLRLEVIQTVSVIGRCTPNIQIILCNQGIIELLTDILMDRRMDMRQWAAHCLSLLMIKNFDPKRPAWSSPKLKVGLEDATSDDWSKWPHNAASEVLETLTLSS